MADANGHIFGSRPGIITPDGSNESQRSMQQATSKRFGLYYLPTEWSQFKVDTRCFASKQLVKIEYNYT